MYELTIPDDIDDVNLITEVPSGGKLKFADFLRATLLNDKRFSVTSDALESQASIRAALRGKGPGDVIELHPNDYNTLLEAAKAPQLANGQGYHSAAWVFLPFIDAIKGAKKKKRDE